MVKFLVIRVFLVVVLASIAVSAEAGPQHFGSGQGYLAAIEETGGVRRLAVYESPMRAKDAVWIPRWLDRTTDFSNVVPGGIAVGNFWPASFGKEYLAAVCLNGTTVSIKTLAPPEYFTKTAWTLAGTATPSATLVGSVVGVSSGDLLSQSKDQLLLLMLNGTSLRIAMLSPPASSSGTSWTVSKQVALPTIAGQVKGFACGDFWNENKDQIAIATSVGGATAISFFSFNGTAFSFITGDAAADLPALADNGLAACDYVQDGFDVLTLAPADTSAPFQLRTAPAKPGQTYNQGPTYNGQAYSRQILPGDNGASSTIVMRGTFQTGQMSRIALAAGRVFGYVNTTISSQFSYNSSPDAEIAFTHRTPLYSLTVGSPHFGWPFKDEAVTYEIALKNNGSSTITAGAATLKVWINTPYRNADTNPATCDAPDFTLPVTQALPPFDPNNPAYVKLNVNTTWPYDLISCGARATWKKVNLDQVGERWLVVSMDCTGDTNVRNNRYEAALAGQTYHPIFRASSPIPGCNSTLGDRRPTVQGDPCSLEYLSRKMADALLCVWERSGTTANEDVLQRPYFDSYEIGFPDDIADETQRLAAWAHIQEFYEGWRELDLWWGQGQEWEKYDWGYSPELHESEHLFHPLGDLYGLFVFPVWTGTAKMADGAPVQISSNAWGPDLFSEGQAIIDPAGCEMMKRNLVGIRGMAEGGWWELTPDKIYIRVLDRSGNPVPNADVTIWPYGEGTALATGTTGGDGRWEVTNLLTYLRTDRFGRKHYSGFATELSTVFTVKIGDDYQDCAIWGTDDTVGLSSQGRLTVMYNSFVNETGWTWDFKTNFRPGVPAPSFKLESAVQGSLVQLGITGTPNTTYRLYRRWEPSYIRNPIGEYPSASANLTISQDMAAADSHASGRFRAIYEVTEVTASGESLPRTISVTGLKNARGVSTLPDGRLIVSANAGIANPFGILFNGTTPYQEFLYHYRFGHTATKIVPSRLLDGHFFATLASSDTDPDYRFDVVVPPQAGWMGYDVRNDIGQFQVIQFSTSSPWTVRLSSAVEAARLHPNDEVVFGNASATIQSVASDTLTLDAQLIPAGSTNVWLGAQRCAGRPGTRPDFRELSNARGMTTILYGGKEYIVIADTGNRRVVVWDSDTGYVTSWLATDTLARPAAVAPHPTIANKFYAIVRRSDRQTKLYLFTFDGTSLTPDPSPVSVSAGDSADGTEMGLASVVDPSTGGLALAITDAANHRVLLFKQVAGTWTTTATYTQATGTYAGTAALVQPCDVAFVAGPNELNLYALDHTGSDVYRLVTLSHQTFSASTSSDAKELQDGTWAIVSGITSGVFDLVQQFYIQDPGRSSGIQVRQSGETPQVGEPVVVSGTMATDPLTRERYIAASSWPRAGDPDSVKPLGLNARALGGSASGLQEGVFEGSGLSNIGLLVRVCGNVLGKAADGSYVCVSDGSGTNDGASDGIRIDLSALSPPQRPAPWDGEMVLATGVSSMYCGNDDNLHRMVRVRSASDFGYASRTTNVVWETITGPRSDNWDKSNRTGTDGSSVYCVFSQDSGLPNTFYKYSFTPGFPTTGTWTKLANPTRYSTVPWGSLGGDLAYQNGFLYNQSVTTNVAGGAWSTTITRYNIAQNAWETMTSPTNPAYDFTGTNCSGNGLVMDPANPGLGVAVWQAGNYWVEFNWNAKTADNGWIGPSYDLNNEGVTDGHWVSRNEDSATDGAGTYYATHNDWTVGLSAGDVIYYWQGLAKQNSAAGITPCHKLASKLWQSGYGQSIEFIPSNISPSGHNELWMVRATDGTTPQEGWGSPTDDWARLDLSTLTWTSGQLPGTVGYTGEITLANGSVFVRGIDGSWYVAKLH